MDNVARTVSLKGKGPAILWRLVRALDAGEPVETHRRDTMAIDGRYGFLFGAGSPPISSMPLTRAIKKDLSKTAR
jgi:hypothetical protein